MLSVKIDVHNNVLVTDCDTDNKRYFGGEYSIKMNELSIHFYWETYKIGNTIYVPNLFGMNPEQVKIINKMNDFINNSIKNLLLLETDHAN